MNFYHLILLYISYTPSYTSLFACLFACLYVCLFACFLAWWLKILDQDVGHSKWPTFKLLKNVVYQVLSISSLIFPWIEYHLILIYTGTEDSSSTCVKNTTARNKHLVHVLRIIARQAMQKMLHNSLTLMSLNEFWYTQFIIIM